jgi:hypothetical protein
MARQIDRDKGPRRLTLAHVAWPGGYRNRVLLRWGMSANMTRQDVQQETYGIVYADWTVSLELLTWFRVRQYAHP